MPKYHRPLIGVIVAKSKISSSGAIGGVAVLSFVAAKHLSAPSTFFAFCSPVVNVESSYRTSSDCELMFKFVPSNLPENSSSLPTAVDNVGAVPPAHLTLVGQT